MAEATNLDEVNRSAPSTNNLLRMFQSESFECHMHMYYLNGRKESGVHDYLVNLLYRRPDSEVHFYLPQLCQLACARESTALPRFLRDKSKTSMHLALKTSWIFQAVLEDNIPVLSKVAARLKEEIEMAGVNSKTPADCSERFIDLFLRRRMVGFLCRYRSPPESEISLQTRACIQKLLLIYPRLTEPYTPGTPGPSADSTPGGRRTVTIAPGFMKYKHTITVPGAKIRLPLVYNKLGTPFNYTSFSREYHGVLHDDQELQPYIAKQRRSEYFNNLDRFVALLIEASNRMASEPDRSLRHVLIKKFIESIDEWMFCRRCTVAASEGVSGMTGLAMPFARFTSTKPTNCDFLVKPTSIHNNDGKIGSPLELVRLVAEETKVFSSRKRAPYLLVFELADLDEDLFSVNEEALHRALEVKRRQAERRQLPPITPNFKRGDTVVFRQQGEDDLGTESIVNDPPSLDPNMTEEEEMKIINDLKLEWSDMYLYEAVINNLHNLELYIPPFLTRPLTKDEWFVISEDKSRTKDCHCLLSENSPCNNPSECAFACSICGATKLFYEAIKNEPPVYAVKRSLGVALRPHNLNYPNIPPWRAGDKQTRRRSAVIEENERQITRSYSTGHNSDSDLSNCESTPVAETAPVEAPNSVASETDVPSDISKCGTPGQTSPATKSSSRSNVVPLRLPGETLAQQAIRVRRAIWGELWSEKIERLRMESPYGKLKTWRCGAVMVKGGDDVRQELLASQLIQLFAAIYNTADLPLWLYPYEILVTGGNCGIIEFVPDTQSLDAIKQKFSVDSISKIFVAAFADNLEKATRNYIESHAAYSLVSYILQVKDRHNGNLLLTSDGRLIHIDYGFMLSNSPGFVNFETSPFKLSPELLAVMGGPESDNFEYFKELMIKGFLEIRKYAERVILLIEMMFSASKMPCFCGNPEAALQGVKDRFMLNTSPSQCTTKVLELIDLSINNWRTQQYDIFQRLTNGIL